MEFIRYEQNRVALHDDVGGDVGSLQRMRLALFVMVVEVRLRGCTADSVSGDAKPFACQ